MLHFYNSRAERYRVTLFNEYMYEKRVSQQLELELSLLRTRAQSSGDLRVPDAIDFPQFGLLH